MNTLEKKIQECHICGNLPKPKTASMVVGTVPILVIGESPAKNGWIKTGRAFYNSNNQLLGTGKVLNKLLSLIGLNINQIYFTECCKCYVESRNSLQTVSNACKPYLLEQIANSPCKIILTMGLHPTKTLLNKNINKLSDVVGKEFNINFNGQEKLIIPIYHTSPINPQSYKGNEQIFLSLKKLL